MGQIRDWHHPFRLRETSIIRDEYRQRRKIITNTIRTAAITPHLLLK
jgi:hypothetical protein